MEMQEQFNFEGRLTKWRETNERTKKEKKYYFSPQELRNIYHKGALTKSLAS